MSCVGQPDRDRNRSTDLLFHGGDDNVVVVNIGTHADSGTGWQHGGTEYIKVFMVTIGLPHCGVLARGAAQLAGGAPPGFNCIVIASIWIGVSG
jgi:hypothetical protein